jgi:hypothetical protein
MSVNRRRRKGEGTRKRLAPNPEEGWSGQDSPAKVWEGFHRGVRVFFAVGTIVTLFIVAFMGAEFFREKSVPPSDEESGSDSPKAEYVLAPEGREERSALAIKTLDQFFLASGPTARAEYLFDQGDIPAMDEFYEAPQKHKIINPKVTAVDIKGREILIISFQDETGVQRAAPMEWKGDGYQLHWGAMMARGQMTWEDFLRDEPTDPVAMRVVLSLEKKPSFEFDFDGNYYGSIEHPELSQPLPVVIAPHSWVVSLSVGERVPLKVLVKYVTLSNGTSWPLVSGLIHLHWIKP